MRGAWLSKTTFDDGKGNTLVDLDNARLRLMNTSDTMALAKMMHRAGGPSYTSRQHGG